MSNVDDDMSLGVDRSSNAEARPLTADEMLYLQRSLCLHNMSTSDFRAIYSYLPTTTGVIDRVSLQSIAQALCRLACDKDKESVEANNKVVQIGKEKLDYVKEVLSAWQKHFDNEQKLRKEVEQQYRDYQKRTADEHHDLEVERDAMGDKLMQEQKSRKELEQECGDYQKQTADEYHELEIERDAMGDKLVQEQKSRKELEQEYGDYQKQTADEYHELQAEQGVTDGKLAQEKILHLDARERLSFCYEYMTSEQSATVERNMTLSRRITALEEERVKRDTKMV